MEALRPIRQRALELKENPGYVLDVLADGARRSREIATATMSAVRMRMGLQADPGATNADLE